MASWQMTALGWFMRITQRVRTADDVDRQVCRSTNRQGPPPAPRAYRERHLVDDYLVDGFDCHSIRPRTDPRGCVVFLHGGAFLVGAVRQHWALASMLADAGLQVEMVHYGLVPDHGHHEAADLVRAVYDRVAERFGPASTAILGDSAGGTLALLLAQSLPEPPARLVLVSPWLDLSLQNAEIPEFEKNDPWLTSAALRRVGELWAGDTSPADPVVSPAFGPLGGLPPTTIYCGTRDLLLPDIRALAARALAEGVSVSLTEQPGAIHVYPLLPTPEGRRARTEIVDRISGSVAPRQTAAADKDR